MESPYWKTDVPGQSSVELESLPKKQKIIPQDNKEQDYTEETAKQHSTKSPEVENQIVQNHVVQEPSDEEDGGVHIEHHPIPGCLKERDEASADDNILFNSQREIHLVVAKRSIQVENIVPNNKDEMSRL